MQAPHVSHCKLKLLVNFLGSKLHPLVHCEPSIIPGIVLLEQRLELVWFRMRKTVLLGYSKELLHHSRELCHLDDTILVGVMVSKDLQHVPVQLYVFWTGWRSHGSLDESLVLIQTSMINDRMRIHGGSLGSNVLLAEFEPFIEGDDTSGLQIHGVEHLLSGGILLGLCLVQSRIIGSISIGSGHRCSSIDQLGEGGFADKTISVGVCIHKELEEGMIQFRVRVALLVRDCPLHKPDEVFFGLVESVNWARHFDGRYDTLVEDLREVPMYSALIPPP